MAVAGIVQLRIANCGLKRHPHIAFSNPQSTLAFGGWHSLVEDPPWRAPLRGRAFD
jgi:hypothetical protein